MSLPIRARLTVWYAALLALIILALGAFLVLRLRSDLQAAIDRDIRPAAATIAAGYTAQGTEEFLDVAEKVLRMLPAKYPDAPPMPMKPCARPRYSIAVIALPAAISASP